MLKFSNWLEQNKPNASDFIKGKVDKITLNLGPVSLGHQPHTTGSGAHDSRPKRQRTRNGQKQAWLKDVEKQN